MSEQLMTEDRPDKSVLDLLKSYTEHSVDSALPSEMEDVWFWLPALIAAAERENAACKAVETIRKELIATENKYRERIAELDAERKTLLDCGVLVPFGAIERDVREFMLKAEQSCPATPTMPSPSVCQLRIDLIHEELAELEDSLGDGDLVEAYDAIIDMMVVVVGTAVAMGLKLQPGWDEVHRSNMTKFIDGHRREDGKWIKGPSWAKPNLAPIIDKLKGGAK